jgi:uracil-DNA glycosylase
MNLQEIKQKLFNKFAINGWDKVFRSFVYSTDFDNIITKLWELSNDDKKFTPPLKQVFRAFMECPLDTLKVIMVGQDPYPTIGVADGIAFSCGNTKKQQPSLKFIFKAVNKTVYSDKKDITTFDPDLTRWSNQGVLMLNTSLTTEINKIGKHIPIWDPFIKYLIDMLNSKDKDYVWVLIGKQAQQNEDLIDNILRNTQILKCSHPASAAYKQDEDWNCNDIFNQVNNALVYDKKPKIIW